MQGLLGIKKAIANLNPEQVRKLSERPLRIAICSASENGYAELQRYLLGNLAGERKRESMSFLRPGYEPGTAPYDLVFYDETVSAPKGALVFRSDKTADLAQHALKRHPDLGVALARSFPPFRKPYIDSVIRKVCQENTLFSLATALPDVIPSFIELPWAVAEFASDTAFLTANQLKMAFLIAAASDREIGYRQQKSEVATVVAGAFGWRAIARQLVGKIPFGGGLIAKAAVAYAGTKVIGLSLERLYSIGYTYSRDERQTLYADSVEQGKRVAGDLLAFLKPELAAKYAAAKKRMATVIGS